VKWFRLASFQPILEKRNESRHLVSHEMIKVLQDPACIQLMRDFIKARPELWNEGIGV
jgi:hypothetical protein